MKVLKKLLIYPIAVASLYFSPAKAQFDGGFMQGVVVGSVLSDDGEENSEEQKRIYEEQKYIAIYKEKRNFLRKLADTNRDKTLDNRERMKMYKMCGVDKLNKPYVLTIEDLEKGIENYLNYFEEQKYEEKRTILRKLADTNRDKTLDNSERTKMYKMCGVADKPTGYVLNIKDLEKGIENYLNN